MNAWRAAVMGSLLSGSALADSARGALSDPDQLDALASSFDGDLSPLAHGLSVRLGHLQAGYADGEAGGDTLQLSQDTLDLIAPLADRVGLSADRARLEDESFRLMAPDAHSDLAQAIGANPAADAALLATLKSETRGMLDDAGVAGDISGRVKSVYSLHRKMQRKALDLNGISDRIALRVTVDSVDDCYRVRDMLHARYTPVLAEGDDYIAHPKSNGYQSLHTVLQPTADSGRVEFQVRTHAMHHAAESGAAAHWLYKLEPGKVSGASLV